MEVVLLSVVVVGGGWARCDTSTGHGADTQSGSEAVTGVGDGPTLALEENTLSSTATMNIFTHHSILVPFDRTPGYSAIYTASHLVPGLHILGRPALTDDGHGPLGHSAGGTEVEC
ncbi:hypothetical protein CPB86DRAFT_803087 [Serendipita vermifera]|nr:hypothetical protein CPB86DRAFT_803087 [Serendipita vermifera]